MIRSIALLALVTILSAGVASAEADGAIVEMRLEVLRQFRTEFFDADRSYSPKHRAAAVARLAGLELAPGDVSPAYFELEIARIVALADNGHTISLPARRTRRYDRVPIRLFPFGEAFHVVRVDADLADLLGGRLVGIDGNPIADVLAVARTLAGGTEATRDGHASYFLESPEQLAALGLAERSGAATYRFEMPDGTLLERLILADPPNPKRDRTAANRWLYPDPYESQGPEWRSLLRTEDAPWALRDPDTAFRWRKAPELDAIVMELRTNRDAERPIRDFLAEMRTVLEEQHPRNLILDMRMNTGGDLNTTRDFMQRLPSLVSGRIFVLTGAWTFSAGITSVGYLKQADPGRVTIVGEPVGDRLEFWAEGDRVVLEPLDIAIRSAMERHDYRTGCRPFRDCHAPVVQHPISLQSLAPDIPAPFTFEAYRATIDPGIRAIATSLASSRR